MSQAAQHAHLQSLGSIRHTLSNSNAASDDLNEPDGTGHLEPVHWPWNEQSSAAHLGPGHLEVSEFCRWPYHQA